MEEDVGGTILTFYFLSFSRLILMCVCVCMYVCVVPMESREGHQIPIKTVLTWSSQSSCLCFLSAGVKVCAIKVGLRLHFIYYF